MFGPGAARPAVLGLLAQAAGGDAGLRLGVRRAAPPAAPGCGAPADARPLLVRALGESAPGADTVRSVDLAAGAFVVDGLPAALAGVELEVLGDGGAVRAI